MSQKEESLSLLQKELHESRKETENATNDLIKQNSTLKEELLKEQETSIAAKKQLEMMQELGKTDNQTILDQQKQIQQLEKRVEELKTQVKEMGEKIEKKGQQSK